MRIAVPMRKPSRVSRGRPLARLVDLELEPFGQEPFDAFHHPLAHLLTAHIDVAVVGIAHEATAASLQLLVQHVQHQVRQQRREWSALRRALLRRADQAALQHAGAKKAADELQETLVSHPLCNKPHQNVVVHPVEELLQVDVHYIAMPGRDVLLRPLHGPMRRAPRPEAEARLGERSVPLRLQHLHYLLLDEAVEHVRDANRPCATRCLRYLHAPYRLWLVGALQQLGPDRGPVLFQVGASSLTVMPSMPGAPLLRFTCANAFFRFSRSTTASIDGPATAERSRQVFAARASVSWAAAFGASPFAPGAQVQLPLIFLPHGLREIAALLAPSTVRAFGGAPPPTMPSNDFCVAVSSPYDNLSPESGTTTQTSRGKTDRLHRTPAGFTTPTLDDRGLRDHLLA